MTAKVAWEVIGRDAQAGTIEAVDTTKWLGFKDDGAIRVRADRGDLGTNARRIRAWAERLK